MRLKDMTPQVRYVVTKGGSTLNKGDNVWLDYDGGLMNTKDCGWLMPQEWKKFRNEVEFDKAYYEKEIEKMRAKIRICESLIEEYAGEKQ